MATDTPTTRAPAAHTTRRDLLIAAPVIAAAAAVPALATAAPDRSAWDAAMRAYARVKAEDDAFTPGWWSRWQECKAECDRVPHVTLRPSPYSGNYGPVTTADDWFVRQSRHAVAQMDSGKMRIDPKVPAAQDHFDLQREVAQAADERDAVIQRIRDRYEMDAADDEAERLGDCIADAEGALMALPAPDRGALLWKLEKLLEADSEGSTPAWSRDYVRQVTADMRRLLGEA